MNIFKTFEIFLKEPLSILKKSIIQIVNINSPILNDTGITVSSSGKNVQLNVINNDKIYKLLKSVQHKREEIAAKKLKLSSKPTFGSLTLKS